MLKSTLALLTLTLSFFAWSADMKSRPSLDVAAPVLELRAEIVANEAEVKVRLSDKQRALEEAKPVPTGLTRVGITTQTEMHPTALVWQAVTGGYVAHVRITAEGAVGVRAKLSISPEVTISQLRARSTLSSLVEVIEQPQRDLSRTLWTPYTDGDTQLVELFSKVRPSNSNLMVEEVVHFDQSLTTPPVEVLPTAAGTCSPDVSCSSNSAPLDTAIAERKKSVALLGFSRNGGNYVCTATLLNSTQYPAAFLLTANHCIPTVAEAASVTTVWFAEAESCGGIYNKATGNARQVAGGAQLVFTNPMLDSTLLRMNQLPPAGTVYAGWNASPVNAGEAIVSMSHPKGDVMKFAQGAIEGKFRINRLPISMFGIKFTRGIIEGGSSGSGLFTLTNGSLQLRGVLSSSSIQNSPSGMSCTNTDEYAFYSSFESFLPEISNILEGTVVIQNDIDPNQPVASARPIALGSKLQSQIQYAGDMDVFRIDVAQTGTLSVYSKGGNDLVGALLDAQGNMLASNDDSQADTNDFGISRQVTPGTYYVSVAHFEPRATSSNYDIHADFVNTTNNYTDLWWNAAESGWGINVNHQGNILFATLFTYDLNGKDLWLSTSLYRQADDSYIGQLVQTSGPAFNAAPFNSSAVTRNVVGNMRLAFNTTESGTLSYTYYGAPVTKSISRMSFSTPATKCGFTIFDRSETYNWQDLWWDPLESGWGLNLSHQGKVLFATLFTYDTNGTAMWLSGSANQVNNSNGSYQGDLFRTTGPGFNAAPFTPLTPANYSKVGTIRFDAIAGHKGKLTYTVNGVNVVKNIQRMVFSNPASTCAAR